jgi:uncharacterized delta-60 repeat protein
MFTRFKRLIWKASLLATVLSLLAFSVALAASGDLDTSFGGDGLVTDFAVPSNPARWETVRGMVVQPDGKIVIAGTSNVPSTATHDFAVARYNSDGTPDSTFSKDGRQVTNFGGIDQALDVVLQSNGKIVVIGQKCSNDGLVCDVALARYNPGGAPDITFSGDGMQVTDFGGDDNGSFGGVAIHDNKIVVAGYMWNGTDYDFALYRYLLGGKLDSTFSGDGMVSFNFGAGRQDTARDVVVQSDGKIVVVGETGNANYENNNFALARLNADGSFDTTFSGDGKQTANFGGDDYPFSVTLQANGKIVVAGTKFTATLSHFAVARFNTGGAPDVTFNGAGRKAFSVISNLNSGANDVVVQADGKIVLTGVTYNGTNDDFALVRLTNKGSFDTSFSGDGITTFDFGGDDFSSVLTLQPSDGKYLLGGGTHDGTQRDFALARILP